LTLQQEKICSGFNAAKNLKKQIFDVVADIEVKYLVSISTLVLSEENFAFLKKRERRIAADIEKEGIPL